MLKNIEMSAADMKKTDNFLHFSDFAPDLKSPKNEINDCQKRSICIKTKNYYQ